MGDGFSGVLVALGQCSAGMLSLGFGHRLEHSRVSCERVECGELLPFRGTSENDTYRR